jgi:hypothetical protein
MKPRRRRRAVREDADSPFSGHVEPHNRAAIYAYRCSIWGLLPGLGLVLGPVGLIWGWLAWRRARNDPQFTAQGPVCFAMVLGALITLTQWPGAVLIYLGLCAMGVL